GGSACDALYALPTQGYSQVAAQNAAYSGAGDPLFKFHESSMGTITNGQALQYTTDLVPSLYQILKEHVGQAVAGCNIEGIVSGNSATCNVGATGQREFDYSLQYIGPAPAAQTLYEFVYAVNPGGDWIRAAYVGMHSNVGAYLYVDPANVQTVQANPASGTGWTNPANGLTSNDAYATTNTRNAQVVYSVAGLGIPAAATINTVLIGAEYYTTTNETVDLEISWDGGVSWSAPQTPPQTISISAAGCTAADCAIIAGAGGEYVQWLNVTGENAWTAAQLNSGQVQVRVAYAQVGGGAGGTDFLDSLPIMATYTQ
ncbi:MAG TPA: hypothetical protein VI702_06855, partial [Nitrospiria bacterium]